MRTIVFDSVYEYTPEIVEKLTYMYYIYIYYKATIYSGVCIVHSVYE